VAPTGRYDLMAELVCRDREHLLDAIAGEIGSLEGVARVDTFMYLRLLYRTAAGVWSAGSPRRAPIGRAAGQAGTIDCNDSPLEVAHG
jgi:hypothetical protein